MHAIALYAHIVLVVKPRENCCVRKERLAPEQLVLNVSISRGNMKRSSIKICSVCGKDFIPGSSHLYRAKRLYQCSYTCYRKEGGDDGRYSKSKLLEPDPSLSKMRKEIEK